MTGDLIAAAADANLMQAAQAWALATGGEAWERDGVSVASSNAPMRSFNNVFVTRAAAGLGDTLAMAIAHFAELRVPFRLRVKDAFIADVEPALAANCLVRRGGIPSLAVPIDGSDASPTLEIRRVDGSDALRDHVDIVASAFDWQPDALARVFTKRLVEDERWRGYVGYADGGPVAASQLFVTDAIAGIYYVATLEAYRRRGYGEEMTRHAMIDGARSGCTTASLQASPMGRPIYERMGYRTVFEYATFVRGEEA